MTTPYAVVLGQLPRPPMTWADYSRYLIALVVGFAVVHLLLSGGGFGDPAQELLGWGQVVIGLALASAIGHALPSVVRRRVSLTLSSILTWLVTVTLIALSETVESVGRGLGFSFWDSMIFSSILVIPLVLIAHVLRLIVPPLRPHLNGKPVRYAMSGSSSSSG